MLVSNLLNLIVQRIVLTYYVRKVLKHLSILIILFIETTTRIFLTCIRRCFKLSILTLIVGVKYSIIKVEIFPFFIIGHFISF